MSIRLGAPNTTNDKRPILSICIPSYNRRDRIKLLVESILSVAGDFEVRVHVDGSTDGTYTALGRIRDPRLHVTTSENRGKTAALLTAVRAAKGKFIMSFDDDDSIYPDCLRKIISRCIAELPAGVGGFIYHLDGADGRIVGTTFPQQRSNFIALRADLNVRGDKKEVVLADLLKKCAYDPGLVYRRAPPSLSWARIALTHDVLCFNESVGIKRYLAGGISSRIWRTKFSNAYPMYLLRKCHVSAFFSGRYRSRRHFTRCLLAAAFYGLLSLVEGNRTRRTPAVARREGV